VRAAPPAAPDPEHAVRHVDTCIGCGARELSRYATAVAPFVASRVPSLGTRAELVRCRSCGLAFFDPRLEDGEVGALYRNYRDAEYQRARQQHEPDYTPALNAGLGGELEVAARTANMRAFLAPHLRLGEVRSVLDYGGDRGQFILDELAGARRVVYEVSGVEPRPGVVALSDWQAVARERYDLVLCNHVLEHASFPGEVVRQLAAVAHAGTRLYFEVPVEDPFAPRRPGSVFSPLRRLVLAARPLADLYYGRRKLPLLHEHVNLFSVRSLARTLERHGLVVDEVARREFAVGAARTAVVSCVAHLAPTHG
jgi:hypothetical protein